MPGSRLALSNAKPPPPPFSDSWALTSSSWSPARPCSESNELLQPIRTMCRVCVGWRRRWYTELPFTPGLPRGQVAGVGHGEGSGGGRSDGPQSGHCQPPDPHRLHREPVSSCPPGPLHGRWAHTPWHRAISPGGGRMSFYSLSSQLCQGWLSTCGAGDTEKESDAEG